MTDRQTEKRKEKVRERRRKTKGKSGVVKLKSLVVCWECKRAHFGT